MNTDRFLAKVKKSDGCWEWQAAMNGAGYGVFGIGNKRIDRSHRISWRIHFGEIPEGLFVCHKCDNRKCVNPDHLFIGTNQDNVDDCVAKGRNSKPPPIGGWNRINLPNSIMKNLGNKSDASLAREAGVSKKTIQKRRNALGIASWSSVNGNPTQFKKGQPHPRWSKG